MQSDYSEQILQSRFLLHDRESNGIAQIPMHDRANFFYMTARKYNIVIMYIEWIPHLMGNYYIASKSNNLQQISLE